MQQLPLTLPTAPPELTSPLPEQRPPMPHHQMPQQTLMPQLQVSLPQMPPMPQLPGQHVPGIPLRGTLSMALPGVEEMAVIADDDMSRRAAYHPS